MRLTLQQIEAVFLHSEKERQIPPATWALLYFAARNAGIEKIEGLQVLKREPYDAGLFIEAFLVPDDIEEAKKLSITIGLEMATPHCDQAVVTRLLDAWIAKTVMLNIARQS